MLDELSQFSLTFCPSKLTPYMVITMNLIYTAIIMGRLLYGYNPHKLYAMVNTHVLRCYVFQAPQYYLFITVLCSNEKRIVSTCIGQW